MTVKPVFRYDRHRGIFRLFRILWKCGKGAGYGGANNYHAAFKIAFSKQPFALRWNNDDKVLTVVFLRLTYEKSYGGVLI